MDLQSRVTKQHAPLAKVLVHSSILFCFGLMIGVIIKLLDIYTTNLGNIFSQLSVWVFLCTTIAVYSSTAKRAAIHVFCFCVGMLLTYYLTADLTESVYSLAFVYGWMVFAFFSPLMGFYVWYAKGEHWISTMITSSVLVLTLMAEMLLFDKLRLSDLLFVSLTGFVLLKNKIVQSKKKERGSSGRL